jgi:hypothetical protein
MGFPESGAGVGRMTRRSHSHNHRNNREKTGDDECRHEWDEISDGANSADELAIELSAE